MTPATGRPISIRSEVLAQVNQVAERQGKLLAPLNDDLALLDSGLDSLCFAIIVARLEDALGVDPFSTAEDVHFPVTLGEFIQFYENARRVTASRCGMRRTSRTFLRPLFLGGRCQTSL